MCEPFVEPEGSQRFRLEDTGEVKTYAELVEGIAAELRPSDATGLKILLDILNATPVS